MDVIKKFISMMGVLFSGRFVLSVRMDQLICHCCKWLYNNGLSDPGAVDRPGPDIPGVVGARHRIMN